VKEAGQEPQRFRKLAVGAAVSVWLGLILLAVGLVFSCSSQPQQAVAANAGGAAPVSLNVAAASAGGDGAAVQLAPGTPAAIAVDATAVEAAHLAAAADSGGGASVFSDEATASPTATASRTASATPLPPTATAVPTDTPTPTPTPVRGKPVRIVAPSIGLDAAVIEVGWHVETIEGTQMAVWDVADYAAGWHKTSARPGDGGNIVISGHHNILGEVFRYVIDLQPGAEVLLYADDREEPYVYKVEEVLLLPEKGQPLEVRRENAAYIEPTAEERLTLVTCWPYENNTHRVIAIAKPG